MSMPDGTTDSDDKEDNMPLVQLNSPISLTTRHWMKSLNLLFE